MTINEIAEKAGVSIGTVDRVIHNRGRVAEDTVQRIQAIIDEYGYTPNPIARQLKKKKPYVIGIVLPLLSSENGYWKLLHQGMESACESRQVFSIQTRLVEFNRHLAGDCYSRTMALISGDEPVDSLVIAPVSVEDMLKLIPELAARNTPYVFVDSPLPDGNPLSVVVQNPYKAGVCAARLMSLLRPQGRSFVSLILNPAYNLKERSHGFSAYLAEHNPSVSIQEAVWSGTNQEELFSFLDDIFSSAIPIDGLFVPNDSVSAIPVWLASRNRPKDFALIGYDLIDQNRVLLESGDIDCIISQEPTLQGESAINTLFRKFILQSEIESQIDMPIEIYIKENLI